MSPIGHLTVTYQGKAVDRIDEPIIQDSLDYRFSVQIHVRPDPAVYGSAMDR